MMEGIDIFEIGKFIVMLMAVGGVANIANRVDRGQTDEDLSTTPTD